VSDTLQNVVERSLLLRELFHQIGTLKESGSRQNREGGVDDEVLGAARIAPSPSKELDSQLRQKTMRRIGSRRIIFAI
jgi:hypothetical protein